MQVQANWLAWNLFALGLDSAEFQSGWKRTNCNVHLSSFSVSKHAFNVWSLHLIGTTGSVLVHGGLKPCLDLTVAGDRCW